MNGIPNPLQVKAEFRHAQGSHEFQERRNDTFAQGCEKAAGTSGLLLGLVVTLGRSLVDAPGGNWLRAALGCFTVSLFFSVFVYLGRAHVYHQLVVEIENRNPLPAAAPTWWYIPAAFLTLALFLMGCTLFGVYVVFYL